MLVPILPDSELFRKIQHDLVDTVHQRGARLSAIMLNMFELQSPSFPVLLRFCCFLDRELAQMYSRYCGEYSSKRFAANFVALVCVAISARKSTLTALQMRLLECSRLLCIVMSRPSSVLAPYNPRSWRVIRTKN